MSYSSLRGIPLVKSIIRSVLFLLVMGCNWGMVLSGMWSWGGGGDLVVCLSGDTGLKWESACWSFQELGLDAQVLELDLEFEVLELGLDLGKSTGVPALGLGAV